MDDRKSRFDRSVDSAAWIRSIRLVRAHRIAGRSIDSPGRASTRITFDRHRHQHHIAIDRGVALGVVVAFDVVGRCDWSGSESERGGAPAATNEAGWGVFYFKPADSVYRGTLARTITDASAVVTVCRAPEAGAGRLAPGLRQHGRMRRREQSGY